MQNGQKNSMKQLFVFISILFSINVFAITGSTYNPSTTGAIQKERVNFFGQKVSASVPFGTTQDIDYTIADDYLITGAQIVLTGNCDMDEIQIKVVDAAGVIPAAARASYPLYPTLNQFIDWYAQSLTKELTYPARLDGGMGLKLRATYKNTCTSGAATVRLNYSLHKIL
jgi:hypothetical protein